MCDCHSTLPLPGQSAHSLKVDCGGRDVNESKLAQQMDLLLSDDELRENLTRLNISNTPLTQVPRSVCQLTNLLMLVFWSNRLDRLPDNCFSNMTALPVLVASSNNITELQDGLFDGLNSLRFLSLSFNKIASIGLRVFSNPDDLVSLMEIDLAHNRLRSLEPWPHIRGLHGRQHFKVRIYLWSNFISEFTNNIGWQFNCSRPSYVKLDISVNYIRHLSDILIGWHMSVRQWYCIAHYHFDHSIRSIVILLSITLTFRQCDGG